MFLKVNMFMGMEPIGYVSIDSRKEFPCERWVIHGVKMVIMSGTVSETK